MKAVHIRKSNKTKTDKDWTNSKSFGFVGANSNSKRHLRGKDEFIRLANKEGFATGEAITRKDILMLLEKYPELNNPTWFTSYRNKDGVNPYKLERGKGFILPSVDAVDEVELIYLLIDELPLEHLLKLPKNQHDVVLLRYGINDGIVRTFEEVSKIVGLTNSYCWKLNQKALLKLEEYSGTKISINITQNSREKY